MHPSPSGTSVLATDRVKRQLFSPYAGRRSICHGNLASHARKKGTLADVLFINVLDICGEDSGLHIRTPSGKENIVWMPVHRKNSGPDRPFNRLRHPPIVLSVKGAYGYCPVAPIHQFVSCFLSRKRRCTPCTAGDSKFVLEWAPPHIGRCPINPEQNQCGFPSSFGRLLPDVGVAILRCSHDAVGTGCPVDGGDLLIML